jgi:hypothetical protein
MSTGANDSTDTADIDFLGADAVDDPHAFFAPIRDRDPIQWSARHPPGSSWGTPS